MALTSDVLLLVRPDYVIYDEVRKTEDFEIFADMRLAGVGLVGVTHANRAIDAVQRLIGRVELGMIPQVVDTVIHIEKGKVQQVLEMQFTVKVPAGMVEADLARPVIVVRDFITKQACFEIYTYGEQVVVMPLDAASGGKTSAKDKFAAEGLRASLRRWVDGPYDVEMSSEGSATLYVPERDIPGLIGKGGSHVKQIEEAVGVKLDIRPMASRSGWDAARGKSPKEFGGGGKKGKGRFDPDRPLRRESEPQDAEAEDDEEMAEEERLASAGHGRERRYAEIVPELRKSKKNVVLLVDRGLVGTRAEVVLEDEVVMSATIGGKGEIRISRGSDAGERVMDAIARGELVRLRV
jgi:ATPase